MSEWNAETAEWYARKYGEYATNRLAVEALELLPNSVIVDVGCGTGSALRHAATSVTNGTLIGVDPVPRMLEIAREQTAAQQAGEQIEFREGSAEILPVEDKAADVVFAFDSFDHWQDKERGLAEVRRVLRPDGRFVVVKDGGVPDAVKANQAFVDALEDAGFSVSSEQHLEADGVSFTIWVSSPVIGHRKSK